MYCRDHNYSGSGKIVSGIKLLILLRDRPCLELIIVSSNFQALLFLHDKLLESVGKFLISVKKVLKITGPTLSRINSVIIRRGQ